MILFRPITIHDPSFSTDQFCKLPSLLVLALDHSLPLSLYLWHIRSALMCASLDSNRIGGCRCLDWYSPAREMPRHHHCVCPCISKVKVCVCCTHAHYCTQRRKGEQTPSSSSSSSDPSLSPEVRFICRTNVSWCARNSINYAPKQRAPLQSDREANARASGCVRAFKRSKKLTTFFLGCSSAWVQWVGCAFTSFEAVHKTIHLS